MIKKNSINDNFISNLSASFQKTVSDIIIEKIKIGIILFKKNNININSISVVGGVSNNNYIRKKIENFSSDNNLEIYYPLKEMMGDNAAMIGWACIKNFKYKKNNVFFNPKARMLIDEKFS